jgi:hypothetical protein
MRLVPGLTGLARDSLTPPLHRSDLVVRPRPRNLMGGLCPNAIIDGATAISMTWLPAGSRLSRPSINPRAHGQRRPVSAPRRPARSVDGRADPGTVQSVAGVLTVVVLAYLMVVQGPQITARVLAQAGDAQAERLRRIGRESARTITGYLSGNLLISLICSVLTFLVLALTGAGFLHSLTAGVVELVFFVIYQQVEPTESRWPGRR